MQCLVNYLPGLLATAAPAGRALAGVTSWEEGRGDKAALVGAVSIRSLTRVPPVLPPGGTSARVETGYYINVRH